MIKPFVRHQSRIVLETRIFRLREDTSSHPETGHTAPYYVLEAPDWVNMICLTPERELVLVRQWRHGTGDIELELPAGMVDTGEAPLAAAARELLEETGFSAERWMLLGSVKPNSAYQQNTGFCALAEGCRKVSAPRLDEGEDIEVVTVPVEEVPHLIREGKLRNAMGICAFYLWLEKRGCINWGAL